MQSQTQHWQELFLLFTLFGRKSLFIICYKHVYGILVTPAIMYYFACTNDDFVLQVYLVTCTTVETDFYDHPLVQQKLVLKGRWSVKRGSLRQAHAKSTLSSP